MQYLVYTNFRDLFALVASIWCCLCPASVDTLWQSHKRQCFSWFSCLPVDHLLLRQICCSLNQIAFDYFFSATFWSLQRVHFSSAPSPIVPILFWVGSVLLVRSGASQNCITWPFEPLKVCFFSHLSQASPLSAVLFCPRLADLKLLNATNVNAMCPCYSAELCNLSKCNIDELIVSQASQ